MRAAYRGQHNRKTVNLKAADTPKAKQLFVAVATNNKGDMREKRPPWSKTGGCFAGCLPWTAQQKNGLPACCRHTYGLGIVSGFPLTTRLV